LVRQDYTGILANYILANALHEAIELRGHYVQNACKLAIGSNFGDQFKKELSIAAIMETHNLGMDSSIFIEHIVRSKKGQPDFLIPLLLDVPEKELNGVILSLLNTAENSSTPKAREDLYDTVELFVRQLGTSDIKTELEALIEYFRLKTKLQSGQPTDVDNIIAHWSKRKHFWTYTGVINLLLEYGHQFEKIADEVFAILDHAPELDDININFLLSLNTTRRCAYSQIADDRCATAFKYLKNSVPRWKKFNPIETNLEAYKLLHKVDIDNKKEYSDEIMHWQMIKIERDHLRRLPAMAAQGQYFLIFYDYFESMVFWGLRTEIDYKDFYDQMNIPSEQKLAYLHNWKTSGAEVPNPLVTPINHHCVSSQFIWLGYFLFNPPADKDAQFNDDRKRVDMIARRSLPELVLTICSLPQLPQSIRSLIQRYAQRYQTFQLPELKS
jgi:hypothetical protein